MPLEPCINGVSASTEKSDLFWSWKGLGLFELEQGVSCPRSVMTGPGKDHTLHHYPQPPLTKHPITCGFRTTDKDYNESMMREEDCVCVCHGYAVCV